MVMEQIANLSTRKCCPGSSPGLSAYAQRNSVSMSINQELQRIDPRKNSECSVARLSRRVWDAEVAGSNPATPTNQKGGSLESLLSKINHALICIPPKRNTPRSGVIL